MAEEIGSSFKNEFNRRFKEIRKAFDKSYIEDPEKAISNLLSRISVLELECEKEYAGIRDQESGSDKYHVNVPGSIEDLYRYLFFTSRDAVYLISQDGRMIDVNDSACKALDRTREELLKMHIGDVDPNYPVTGFIDFWKSKGAGEPFLFESTHKRKDGSEFPVEVSGVLFAINKRRFLFGVARDISERKKYENELKESESRFRNLIDYSGIGMGVSDPEGYYILVNNAFAEMLGYSKGELLSMNFRDITVPEDLDLSLNRLEKLLNGECNGYELIKRYIRKDGSVMPGRLNLTMLRDSGGKILNLIAQVQDISRQQMMQDELRIKESQLKEAQKIGKIGHWEWDIKNEELTWSDYLYELWGHKKDSFELTVKNILDQIHPDDQENNIVELERILREEQEGEYQFRIILPDGNLRYLQQKMRVYRDPHKRPVFARGTMLDITQLKAYEKELIISKEKAIESDHLKSAFLANMSHEIRTPMNAILGFSALLEEIIIQDKDVSRYFRMIHSAGERLMRLIDDIVDISKIESNQLSISFSDCRIDDLVLESVDQFVNSSLLKGKKGIELLYNVPEEEKDILVYTDPQRLKQVLDNLISNAIKYTEKGVVEVGYKKETEDQHPVIRFWVRDTGIGIPEKEIPYVFNRFYQAENKGFREGTGLGLSICKGLIDLLGGNITVESEQEKGSWFSFTIPAKLHKGAGMHSSGKMTDKRVPELLGKLIYIAEDDIPSWQYISIILEDTRATLKHFTNGKDLLKEILKKKPHLILLDMNMPVMNGYEFLKEYNALDLKIPVIAQTAYAMPDEHQRCLDLGCVGYIAKPTRKFVLLDEIEKVI